MSQAIFHGPAGRGTLAVALYSADASQLLIGDTWTDLDDVVDFGDALTHIATEQTSGGSGTGIYSWNPEEDRTLADATYPFRAYLDADAAIDDAPEAAGYLQWSGSTQLHYLVTGGAAVSPKKVIYQNASIDVAIPCADELRRRVDLTGKTLHLDICDPLGTEILETIASSSIMLMSSLEDDVLDQVRVQATAGSYSATPGRYLYVLREDNTDPLLDARVWARNIWLVVAAPSV
jgi:hypothetical protein